MKFKLVETLENKIYYITTEKKLQGSFNSHEENSGEEGVHFFSTMRDAKNGIPKLRKKNYLYIVRLPNINKLLYIPGDLILWNAPNLSELFLDKLYGIIYTDSESPIDPSELSIDITEKDEEELKDIKELESNKESFEQIMKFIKSKGYDGICYNNTLEGSRDLCVITSNKESYDILNRLNI